MTIPPAFVHNRTLHLQEWDGVTSTLLNTIDQHPHDWQAIMVDDTQLTLGCAQGVLRSLQNNMGCGQPAGFSENILVWDRSRISAPPDWSDLWDVVQLPGQRTLPQTARLTLEVALLADGVLPQHVYNVLATSAGVDRAFHRLDQLRPYILWWRTPHDAQKLMRHQGFLMGIVPHDALVSLPLRKNSYATSTSGHLSLYTARYWSIPNTSDHDVPQRVFAQLQKEAPHYPDQPSPIQADSLIINNNFWSAHAPVLEARFTAWLHHH